MAPIIGVARGRVHRSGGPNTSMRSFYALRTGCAWRHLPHDFTVGWSAAHKHFLRWCRTGVWAEILTAARGEDRARAGRRRRPSAALVDSSSVKASPLAEPRGFDGAKHVDGIKRHILLDTAATLVCAVVTPADVQDRAANAWINYCRRLDRHYEVTLEAHEGFLNLSQIALLLPRLDRNQLFDTL